MDSFSIGKIIAGLRNQELYLLRKIKPDNTTGNGLFNSFGSSLEMPKPSAPTLNPSLALTNQLPMNNIANIDRAIFVRNLLGLPQTLGEVFLSLQDKNTPIINGLKLENLNQEILKNQKVIAQIFDDTSDVIPIQNPSVQAQNIQTQSKDAVLLFFSGMIKMPDVSDAILKNSKQAIAGLIISMASASKSGLASEQIRETLSIINSCVSMAEANNPTQTLKSLMLLYLPWLPLNEGVGFDLEITPPDGENESNNSKLTVLIQTINYGNVKGMFTLTTSNSVDIYIICSDDFPKNILKKTLLEESGSLAMNTTVDVESVGSKGRDEVTNVETKVNLSATNEMNPYLLLMAHSFIRHTIFIDSNKIAENSTP